MPQASPEISQTIGAKQTLIQRATLVTILLLSASMNLVRLNQVGPNGYGNTYYAAAVQTMLTSWHHFFYLSLDPAGFMTIDKAPLGLWIQTIIAKLFGFHGLSLLLPQALAGILAVFVLYRLVCRAYGQGAGLLAALALAVTPISVVTNRNNTPDALLILSLLLAAWAVIRAVEEDSRRWLLGGAFLVGIGFDIKMLQILLALPAPVTLYWLGVSLPWRERFKNLVLAGLVVLLVALPWVLAVELTPPEQRPYVSGSPNNSVVELIIGYNGTTRLWGENWNAFLGAPGPQRLFNQELAGQISWLLPFALLGSLMAVWQLRQETDPSTRRSEQRNALILWAGWLMLPLVYFSISSFYHRYYLATLAPAVAALFGIGVHALWRAWQASSKPRRWVMLILLVSAGVQILILIPYPQWGRWLIPALISLHLVAAGLLWPRGHSERSFNSTWSQAAFGIAVLALLVAPTLWGAIPVLTCTHPVLPIGGPQPTQCQPFEKKPFLDPNLAAYLQAHRDGARFLAATYDMGIVVLGILETDEPFMALGGYRGSDPVLTVDQFARRVADGEVRFFLSLTQESEALPEQQEIRRWVDEHCPTDPIESQGVKVWGPCRAGE